MIPHKIMQVVLACTEVTFCLSSAHSATIKGKILKCNFRNLYNDLIIGIENPPVEMSSDGVNQFQCEVLFHANLSYFCNLHQSVSELPDSTIRRLIPIEEDFKDISYDNNYKIPESQYRMNKLDEFQKKALGKMLGSKPFNPVIVEGGFGCGKTRVLAAASECLMQKAKKKKRGCRILLCCHYQKSAEILMDKYFTKMCEDKDNPWPVKVCCILNETRTTTIDKKCVVLE